MPGRSVRFTMRNGTPSRSATISRALARLEVARTRRRSEDEGDLAPRVDGAALEGDETADPVLGQREHGVQAVAAERRLLRRPLNFDKRARSRHDHVHVDLGARVLDIVQVEGGRTPNHPY